MSEGPDFWEARWREGRIGFHEGRVNEYLMRAWPGLGLRGQETVLVPLCGKTLDLAWLARQGHRVIGVEFSELAIAAFFAEQKLEPWREPLGALEAWSAGSLTILRGDFFAVEPALLARLSGGAAPRAWWDRAALIALPPAARRAYAARLGELLAPGARGLLLSFEYRQEEMSGPPFSVEEPEVRALFAPPAFAPTQLLQRRELEVGDERRALGVTRQHEALWQLARPG